MNKHETLIENLSNDLAPVKPALNINRMALAWFLLSAIYTVAVTQLLGPIRPGALTQLATEPRFLFETVLGVVSILWFSLLAFRSAVPAALSKKFAVYQPCPGTIKAGQAGLLLCRNTGLCASSDPCRSLFCPATLPAAARTHGNVSRPGGWYVAGTLHAAGLYVRTITHSWLSHSPRPADGRRGRSICRSLA